MRCNVIRFTAFDLILGIILSGVMGIPFIIKISGMHFYNGAGNHASFGIPGYFIAHFKFCCYNKVFND